MAANAVPHSDRDRDRWRLRFIAAVLATLMFMSLLCVAAESSPDAWFAVSGVIVLDIYLMLSPRRA